MTRPLRLGFRAGVWSLLGVRGNAAIPLSIVNLQGKLIYFYFYRKFASKETYAELGKVNRALMQELRAKNPRP